MENTTTLELFGVLGIVSENAESILTYSENTRKVFQRIWRIPPKKEYCSILLIFQEFKKFKNSASGFLSLHTLVCTQKNPRHEG
jgi:hypothetical protein